MNLIRTIREQMEMTRAEMASALGVSESTITRWELRKNPSKASLKAVKMLFRIWNTEKKTIEQQVIQIYQGKDDENG